MIDYTIQPFSPDSYPLLKSLFQAAFQSPFDKTTFAKKYNTAALGHEVIGFFAIHTATQTPAAFYGVFPVKILINNREVLAAQSGDTMTHPAHQNKGLFVKLAQLTYKACGEQGIQLVFGQPNNYSYHGLVNRLHFTHLDDIVRYGLKLRLKTFPLPKLLQKAGLFSIYMHYAKAYLKNRTVKNVQSFTNSLETTFGKVLRNKAYLDYKDEGDKLFIKISSVVFWIKLTDVFWIGDADRYEHITQDMIKKLKRLAFALGYNTITFHFNKNCEQPAFLQQFQPQASEASCFLYLNKEFDNCNLLLTGADFDTW